MASKGTSRRDFARIAGTAAAALPLYGAPALAAREIAEQIRAALGGDWPDTGPDGFKAGNPEASVRGICTTAMATVDVLRQAAKMGLNFVVTHEPTFFGSREDAPPPARPGGGGGRAPMPPMPSITDDPVYKAKKELIEKNGLVVFRLWDHWRARKENDLVTALAESLGWKSYQVSGQSTMYDIPPTTLADAVALIRKRLNLRGGLRSVGDPGAKVRRVWLHPGHMSIETLLEHFDNVDLLLAGEVREWECVPYVADLNTAGEKRCLVTIGRVASEEPGMRACAAWLKTLVKAMPVEWISAGDPYWRAA
ncbi:MAG: Nif3-like dinuclear metal center hexameric protein [bacterium]|jgi:hypothetical protein